MFPLVLPLKLVKVPVKVNIMRSDPLIRVELQTQFYDLHGICIHMIIPMTMTITIMIMIIGIVGISVPPPRNIIHPCRSFPIQQLIEDNPRRPDIHLIGQHLFLLPIPILMNLRRQVRMCPHARRGQRRP